MSPSRRALPILLAAALGAAPTAFARDDLPPDAGRAVDFEREIRPILADRCIACHGPEQRKGGLRLDRPELLEEGGDSGPAFEVGRSDESVLIEKVAGLDPVSVMPPKGDRLTAEQVGLLRAWIDRGAPWSGGPLVEADATDTHWAFLRPTRPSVPGAGGTWARNPIDAFVAGRLRGEGLESSPEADRVTLIRRLSLDLIGLPPTPEEVDEFVADDRPDADERLVDRLLASPHHGERWGRRWLDLARYADTNGYEKDRERSIWPYRDWVIRALNADLPYDRFTVDQVAGDLVPGATADQRIATGFHRNTMINEEGGIDVEQYRFEAVVDRVATTGAAWLGLTVQCAQCHTHKYDPITQREYYELFAFLNNADEPEIEVHDPVLASRRSEGLARIAAQEDQLEDQFPAHDGAEGWAPLKPIEARSGGGSTLTIRDDGLVVADGDAPETDRYALEFEAGEGPIEALRLEALADPEREGVGPGRTPHGNFVVTGLRVELVPPEGGPIPVALASAEADVVQPGFDPAGLLDDDPKTGWAVDDGSGRLHRDHVATIHLAGPLEIPKGARLRVYAEQAYGGNHTLARLRMVAKKATPEDMSLPDDERRRRHLARKLAAWESSIRPHDWRPVSPSQVESRKHATMTVLPDASVLVTGDWPNNDVYEVELAIPAGLAGVTAIRLEALPHESLPDGGPGRAPLFSVGDFILTEFEARFAPEGEPGEARPLAFRHASESHSEKDRPASLAIDGVPDTGWTIKGGVGKPQAAVFELAEPVGPGRLVLTLHQFGIHQMTLGRFRLSLTADPAPVRASGVPAEVEAALLLPADRRSAEHAEVIKRHFLAVAPELAPARAEIDKLRSALPKLPTTMVMRERAPEHRRTTRIHQRGEFLKPADPVEPGVPAVLHPLPEDAPRDRLSFARWLVSEDNPLAGRVAVNRAWQAYFGRGIVGTADDFGTRGERPTHPELLDWLAVEFVESGWTPKALHRRIVGSSTYRQSSVATPEGLARDPNNLLLARGPRLRIEAEVVRDQALMAAGLLDRRIGGRSVYPPQPAGATALAYGGGGWPTSTGPDRYRRGLYTFLKRTAPYASFQTFDAPTSDTACARRERSNTPLQALTLLNDAVFIEASRALARRVLNEAGPDAESRIDLAFRLCLARVPTAGEADAVGAFLDEQLARIRAGELDAARIAGDLPEGQDPSEPAAWTAVARALLNLDETITKE